MNFKRICSVLMIAVMMAALLCGCPANDAGNTTPEEPSGTTAPVIPTTTAPTVEDTKVTYTVYVVDQDGNPVSGVTVQLCDDANCKLPIHTDENGTASASYDASNYHVTLTQLPEGYSCDETEFHFDGDAIELTIVVTAATGE